MMCLSNLTSREILKRKNPQSQPLQARCEHVFSKAFSVRLTSLGAIQAGKHVRQPPSLSALTQKELWDDLDRYLSTDPEMVEDVLMWWHEHHGMYPSLYHMALDYLTIPGVFTFF